MSFASPVFIVFFAIVLLLQLLLRRNGRARQITLLVASYVFYGWWDWRFCGLMLLLTLIAYTTALQHEKHPERKLPFLIGVIMPLAVLAVFKYLNFFCDSFCAVFGIARKGALSIILPVGISFYTFQSLSYTIDVRRRKLPAMHDFLKFALYISFFPQLVAGPIVKASEFLPQLEQDRKPTAASIGEGLNVFFWGLLKKAVLADRLAVFVDAVYAAPGAYTGGTILLAVFAYAFQIYFDFSGYSDMAIGCAKCLGYDLPKNFDLPYIAANVTEFWRRWHISLSTWLQQYLYIPLGGNRRGYARMLLNLFITMLLGGLWHGAGVNFILWGALHGIALCVHKLWMRRHPCGSKGLGRMVSILVTFVFVMLAWVPFRAQDMSTAITVYRRIFTLAGGVAHIYTWALAVPVLMLAATAWCVRYAKDANGIVRGELPRFRLGTFTGTLGFTLLICFTLILMYTGESPFIYFQF